MRKSRQVAAPLLAATALAMVSGCRKPEMQRCVDENNRVVDESLCAGQPQADQQQNMTGHGYVPFVPMYHYYYGGWGGYALGTLVGGGRTVPEVGHSYATSSGRTTTVRGGFGESMGHASGRGGAGE